MANSEKQKRREALMGDRPAIGVGINTVGAPAEDQSLIPGSSDTRDHRGNPRNADTLRSPQLSYGNPYSDEKGMQPEGLQQIDPLKYPRSELLQSQVPGRLRNAMPTDLRQPTDTRLADIMESNRQLIEASRRGLPSGNMGLQGVPAAHMDANLYVNMNAGKSNAMAPDAGQLLPGSTPKKITKKSSKKG